MRGLEILEGLLVMKMKVWKGMLVLMVIVVRVMLVIVKGHAGRSHRGHAGEGVGDGRNGAAVEGGDYSDGSVEAYDSDQLQSPHGSNDDKRIVV
jgi:hypothetical protein